MTIIRIERTHSEPPLVQNNHRIQEQENQIAIANENITQREKLELAVVENQKGVCKVKPIRVHRKLIAMNKGFSHRYRWVGWDTKEGITYSISESEIRKLLQWGLDTEVLKPNTRHNLKFEKWEKE